MLDNSEPILGPFKKITFLSVPPLLQVSYVQYGKWITGTWLKSIWEKVNQFRITVEIAPLPVCPMLPCEKKVTVR